MMEGLSITYERGRESVLRSPDNAISVRPSTLDRALSSPPMSPTSQRHSFEHHTTSKSQNSIVQDLLTPPTSPIQHAQFYKFTGIGTALTLPSSAGREEPAKSNEDASNDTSASIPTTPPAVVPILEYPFDLEVLQDETGRDVEFGSGAWSIVYKAISHPKSKTPEGPLATPPLAPKSSSPLIVAVKTPHRLDAHPILRSEAQILSHLARTWEAEEHIVAFHGFVYATSSIIMSAVPLTLAHYIKDCAIDMRSMYMRRARELPVIGETGVWLSLASQMIGSLQWLHEVAEVVHGDIKPHNILLQPRGFIEDGSSMAFSYTPLLVDFSSSCYLFSSTRNTCPGALSAVTQEYTAPELLSASVMRNPATLPTTASDVFSLAVTLLVAATGDLNVYPATNAFQRQAMASQGWSVINFARNGDEGLRVARYGIVEQVLERAVLKAGMGRVDAGTWVNVVREKGLGDPIKKAF